MMVVLCLVVILMWSERSGAQSLPTHHFNRKLLWGFFSFFFFFSLNFSRRYFCILYLNFLLKEIISNVSDD